MQQKLNSSIQLNKELIAQVISQQEHIKTRNLGNKNRRYQPGKNENKMKNIHSPFGNFPSTHFKDNGKKIGPPRKPLYERSYAKSNSVGSSVLSLRGVGLSKRRFIS